MLFLSQSTLGFHFCKNNGWPHTCHAPDSITSCRYCSEQNLNSILPSAINMVFYKPFLFQRLRCTLIALHQALFSGVLLMNLGIALFTLVVIESNSQSWGRTYTGLLFSSLLLSICIFHSSQLDFDLRNGFIIPANPVVIAPPSSHSNLILGSFIFDPDYYSSLFKDGQSKGCLRQGDVEGRNGSGRRFSFPWLFNRLFSASSSSQTSESNTSSTSPSSTKHFKVLMIGYKVTSWFSLDSCSYCVHVHSTFSNSRYGSTGKHKYISRC
ncbi:hypothetical protein K2173_010915 [Erythroxylum novogranatense]|uniref:Cytochrome c biogenesis B n=1 Tax=Erythroxylum novogranatense TaxID=1862640 RepID=A0AAV8T1A2_9ROSI|nr:hypothetical protein K2173_010915 [Erythroxylum novogranatense]